MKKLIALIAVLVLGTASYLAAGTKVSKKESKAKVAAIAAPAETVSSVPRSQREDGDFDLLGCCTKGYTLIIPGIQGGGVTAAFHLTNFKYEGGCIRWVDASTHTLRMACGSFFLMEDPN